MKKINKSIYLLILTLIGAVSVCGASWGVTVGQAVDNTNLIWDGNWYGETTDTHDGIDAARRINTGSSSTLLSTTVNGPGTLKFYWKYSGQGGLTFVDNDISVYQVITDLDTTTYEDGQYFAGRNWEKVTYRVGSGKHNLYWSLYPKRYTLWLDLQHKYSTIAWYDVSGFLDQVQWIPAPKVTSTSPKNGVTGVSRTSTIAIKFSEKIGKSSNWSKITVKNKYGHAVSITKWVSKNTLYIKTNSKRSSYSYYSVYVPASAVKDSVGNNLVVKYAFKFKTGRY